MSSTAEALLAAAFILWCAAFVVGVLVCPFILWWRANRAWREAEAKALAAGADPYGWDEIEVEFFEAQDDAMGYRPGLLESVDREFRPRRNRPKHTRPGA